ncbi:hypothetical protein [Mariniblastus fucicola]|uniref:Uncharacterized protein n=1 Tax=Mariniblastus fucicola TaxID=980251 RepID=A0A5B9PEU6_9BACT|nr:hypothetical protein [Mariniblastus fucicola]QEG24784.1 hypothetical protein MFFC18_47070 [Mariniblastus fucicola]
MHNQQAEQLLAQRSNLLLHGPDVDELLEAVASKYRLVVNIQSQQVYWNGREYLPDFTPSVWSLFEKLIQYAKETGSAVDRWSFGGRSEISHAGLRSRKSRLTKILDECELTDLSAQIVSVVNGYRLNIKSSEICLHPDLQPRTGANCILARA